MELLSPRTSMRPNMGLAFDSRPYTLPHAVASVANAVGDKGPIALIAEAALFFWLGTTILFVHGGSSQ
jgi:hypothetical protein